MASCASSIERIWNGHKTYMFVRSLIRSYVPQKIAKIEKFFIWNENRKLFHFIFFSLFICWTCICFCIFFSPSFLYGFRSRAEKRVANWRVQQRRFRMITAPAYKSFHLPEKKNRFNLFCFSSLRHVGRCCSALFFKWASLATKFVLCVFFLERRLVWKLPTVQMVHLQKHILDMEKAFIHMVIWNFQQLRFTLSVRLCDMHLLRIVYVCYRRTRQTF